MYTPTRYITIDHEDFYALQHAKPFVIMNNRIDVAPKAARFIAMNQEMSGGIPPGDWRFGVSGRALG